MSHTVILSGVTFVYLLSFILYLVGMVRVRKFWGRVASGTALAGFLAHGVALLMRWKSSYDLGMGHPPLANFYESLIFFAWAILLIHLLIEWRTKSRSLGVFVLPVAFLAMAYASLAPGVSDRIQPLIPALQSNWLTVHVMTCFLAYACFTMAFALGLMHLIRGRGQKGEREKRGFLRLIPGLDALEELLHQNVVLGFVLLTLGIMTGSIWAHFAWGSYWSWDPKETWSLITWIVYALMLHARSVRGWRGRRMAVLALVGFACVIFTYLGVNYLNSLHSYF